MSTAPPRRAESAKSDSLAVTTTERFPQPDLLCSTCKRLLPTAAFYRSNTKGRGFGYRCRDCSRAYAKQRRTLPHVKDQMRGARERLKAENPKKVHDHKRRALVLRRYGITMEEYDELRRSATSCEICGTHDPGPRGWFVDHDHAFPGSVRGILCLRCNSGLGMFQDDLARLRRALAYLSPVPSGSRTLARL